MNELLVVLIIIGTLGLIGTGVYFLFIRDARDTVLNQNIQTAAEEIQSVLALQPSLAVQSTAGTPSQALITEMTSRTNFVWEDSWDFTATDDANTVRFQFVQDGTETLPTASGAALPTVGWLVDDNSAVRLHVRNAEGEWRCALVVLNPSKTDLDTAAGWYEGHAATAVTALTDVTAAAAAAELRGAWYDGGTGTAVTGTDPYTGLHDCSPVVSCDATVTSGCRAAAGASGDYIPEDAQTWAMPVDNGTGLLTTGQQLAPSSTATTGVRTFHRTPSQLDGE